MRECYAKPRQYLKRRFKVKNGQGYALLRVFKGMSGRASDEGACTRNKARFVCKSALRRRRRQVLLSSRTVSFAGQQSKSRVTSGGGPVRHESQKRFRVSRAVSWGWRGFKCYSSPYMLSRKVQHASAVTPTIIFNYCKETPVFAAFTIRLAAGATLHSNWPSAVTSATKPTSLHTSAASARRNQALPRLLRPSRHYECNAPSSRFCCLTITSGGGGARGKGRGGMGGGGLTDVSWNGLLLPVRLAAPTPATAADASNDIQHHHHAALASFPCLQQMSIAKPQRDAIA